MFKHICPFFECAIVIGVISKENIYVICAEHLGGLTKYFKHILGQTVFIYIFAVKREKAYSAPIAYAQCF